MRMAIPAGSIASVALILLTTTAATAESPTPLLDYAAEEHFPTSPHQAEYRTQLKNLEQDLAHHPPPPSDCAHTLGAARFGGLYGELAVRRSMLGDTQGAVEAYRRALDCQPRAASLYAGLAAELMNFERYGEAREAANQGLALQNDDREILRVLAELDFLEEHWTDAISRFEWLLARAPGNTNDDANGDVSLALYWKIFIWLAQHRSGIEHPPFEYHETGPWPQPILNTLAGRSTEAELLEKIQGTREPRRREILCEALCYIGETKLADGESETARRYFAATVNLKVLYFVEHHMALAELAKFRAR